MATLSQQDVEWLTVNEVAEHFRVSPRTVTRWANSGQLRIRKVGPAGRLIRIHSSELNREQPLPVVA